MERAFCLPEADGTLRMLEMIRVCDRMIRQREPVSIMEPTANRETSLAPHERLPEILVVPREKTPTGAAARGNPCPS